MRAEGGEAEVQEHSELVEQKIGAAKSPLINLSQSQE